MKPLSPRQQEIFKFVKGSIAKRGIPPTRQEISDCFGFASLNSAECHLKAIADKGWLILTPGISRGIRIAERAK